MKFVFIIKFLSITWVNQSFVEGRTDRTEICTDTIKLFWNFTWRYFKDAYGVTIITANDSSKYFGYDILECSMYNLPIKFYEQSWNDISHQSKEKIIKRNIVGSFYIFIMKSSETFKLRKDFILDIAKNARIIVFLANATAEDAADILKLIWGQYKILNFVIFRTIKSENALGQEITHLDACVYNPFSLRNNIRGIVYTIKIKSDENSIEMLLQIMDKRLINVHGYPLRIAVFDFQGYMTPYRSENGKVIQYKETEGEIIHAIVKTTNFNPTYFSPRDGEDFGVILPDGNCTGALWEVENGNADIIANMYSIRNLEQRSHEFLMHITIVNFGFVTPKILDRSTISFLAIFSSDVSIILAAAYVTMVLTWWKIQKFHQKLKKHIGRQMDFIQICCMAFGNLLLVSQPITIQHYARCLFSCWMFVSMMTCFAYQATMVEHLADSTRSADIHTLEQLASSNLTLLFHKDFKHILKDLTADEGASGVFTRMYPHILFFESDAEALKRVSESRDATMVTTLLRCRLYQTEYYSHTTKKDLIHVLEEGLPSRLYANVVPLHSPYKERFNDILMRIRESGLVFKWNDDVFFGIKMKSLVRTWLSLDDTRTVYKMQDLSFIFLSWFGCNCLCSLIFLFELISAFVFKNKGKL